MSIKERLREAMVAKSLTIKALSDLSKIPYRSLQNYLRGEREPNAEALVALSTHLNISIDWLLTGKGETVGVEKVQLANQEQHFNQSDLKLLELLNQLDPEVRKELLRGAEEKQRMINMEKQLKELSAAFERLKNTG
ncbi:helix-turn-helix transcriptional regulator [Salmonella enterica subsp. enterica serovar Montevideo]|uniref:helix-turn-helix domain-containing protein n=1 Tax=Enterobacteriaceae TaxID=543 RepID=UPI000BA141EF|nr:MULTISPECIES: helix-turn-helix transcriptional regulator [Enterobacteriaceae]EAS6529531.1 XRE family transcriptional regulator [Salmonella enterica]EBC9678275.1 XRE family transcriptional regulator [Salmonella enterica subsp. enterica serovar Montevideo]ECS3707840.1 XRE family transcriptional regulator [Salmonella enterica subsp. enterica serovar Agona]EIN7388281.1 helix-turn-helix transcriptional regulator [Salmonella enterica subsp. enterica serovar Typhimurium]EBA4983605.1 helix-turn-hel